MFSTIQAPLAALTVFAANVRAATLLRNAMRTLKLRVTVTGTVNVTAAGTGIRNRGSLLAAFDRIGLSENGKDRWNLDPRALRMLSECYSAGQGSPTRLTSAQATAIGDYDLRETFDMHLAVPTTASPTETAFVEEDTRTALEFFVVPNLLASKIVAGGTAALSNLRVEVEQIHDDKSDERPLFVPICREIVANCTASNTAEPIYLRSELYIRGFMLSQDSDIGEVTDIVNGVALIGDHRALIGPTPVKWQNLVDGQFAELGGRVLDTSAHLFLPTIRHARLSTALNPAADRNLRFVFDWQPSVTAGATNSKVRITVLEFERIAGVTADPLPFEA